MKKISALLISFACLSGSAFATNSTDSNSPDFDRLRYICKSADSVTFVRVFPDEMRATLIKTNGLPSYDMVCRPGSGDVWLDCEGADARTLLFMVGGQTAVYHGSMKDTYLDCYSAGGHR